jgi:hypothetical protein
MIGAGTLSRDQVKEDEFNRDLRRVLPELLLLDSSVSVHPAPGRHEWTPGTTRLLPHRNLFRASRQDHGPPGPGLEGTRNAGPASRREAQAAPVHSNLDVSESPRQKGAIPQ